VQQHVADLLAGRRAPGLTRDGDRNPVRAQGSRQLFDLRAFAAAVQAFEGNEFSACSHVGMITG